jgi:hypothetical protein
MCTFAFQTLNIIITAGWLAAGFYDPADAAPVDPPHDAPPKHFICPNAPAPHLFSRRLILIKLWMQSRR